LSGHTDWVYTVAFSPDGNLVASGSWNGEVKVWKVADGTVVKSFTGSPGYVAANPPKKQMPLRWLCKVIGVQVSVQRGYTPLLWRDVGACWLATICKT